MHDDSVERKAEATEREIERLRRELERLGCYYLGDGLWLLRCSCCGATWVQEFES